MKIIQGRNKWIKGIKTWKKYSKEVKEAAVSDYLSGETILIKKLSEGIIFQVILYSIDG